MDPEEFRRFGHQVVDWIADYRARAAALPVMSRVEPGQVRAQLPRLAARRARGLRGRAARPRDGSCCPASRTGSTRASSATSRRTASSRRCSATTSARASASSACRGSRAPRSPRSRRSRPTGCGRWSACPTRGAASSRTRRRRARSSRSLCARERVDRLLARPRRPAGRGARRSSSTSRHTATARSRRPRCSPASAATNVRAVPHDARYAMRADALAARSRADARRRPPAVRGRRHDRHDDHHRGRPGRRDRRGRARSTACGCTSTRRWPARR